MSMVSQPVVPDLLDLRKVPADYSQSVETDLLESSTFQEATATQTGFASFNLAQKGFLHSHSKLFVGLIPAAGTTNTFLPQNVGIASVLDRAVLKSVNPVKSLMIFKISDIFIRFSRLWFLMKL